MQIKLLPPQAEPTGVTEKVALPKSARQDSNPQHTTSVPSNTSVISSLVYLNKISVLQIAMAVCPQVESQPHCSNFPGVGNRLFDQGRLADSAEEVARG